MSSVTRTFRRAQHAYVQGLYDLQDHGHLQTLAQKRVNTQIDAAYQTQTLTELGAIVNLPTPTEFKERKAVSTTYTSVAETKTGQVMGLIVRLTETCVSPSSEVTLWHVSGGMGLDHEWWPFPYGCLTLKKQRNRRIWSLGSFQVVVTPRTVDVKDGTHRAKLTLTPGNGWQAMSINKRTAVKGWAQLSEQTDCSNFVRDRWLKVTLVRPNKNDRVLVLKSRVDGMVTDGQVLTANDDAQIEILETGSVLSDTSGKPMFYPTRLKVRHKRQVYNVETEFPQGAIYLPHGNINGLFMGRINNKAGGYSVVEAHQFMPEHDMVETTLRLANFQELDADDWRIFKSGV